VNGGCTIRPLGIHEPESQRKNAMPSCRFYIALAIFALLTLLVGGGCSNSADPKLPKPHIALTGGGLGGGGQQNNGIGEPQVVFDELAPWDVVNFTDPNDGATCEIIDGRVIIGWKNKPSMPVRDPDYFDDVDNSQTNSQWAQDFVWPQTRLNDTDVAAFMATENLSCYSEWPEIGYIAVLLPEGQTVLDAVSNWKSEYPDLIASVEPDMLLSLGAAWPAGDPTDEHFKPFSPSDTNHQWYLDNRYDVNHDNLPDYPNYDDNAQALWAKNEARAFGDSDHVLAILDTGVDYNGQADLQRNSASYLGTKYGCNSYDSKAAVTFLPRTSGGGRPNQAYLDESADSAKGLGHGTLVAGTASAYINNDSDKAKTPPDPPTYNDNRDIAGLAYNTTYFPIAFKAHGYPATPSLSAMINGVQAIGVVKRIYTPPEKVYWPGVFVPKHNIDVVNCSFGSVKYSAALHDAIYALQSYTLFVCCTGNDDSATKNWYPASYANSVAVAAYDYRGQRWTDYPSTPYVGSNYAPDTDIVAPGQGIWSTDMVGVNIHGDQLGFSTGVVAASDGTSFAAPQVAALAAILSRDHNPGACKASIITTAGILPDINLPWGRLDAKKAVYGP
jgi:hypothetical protein